ncbi:hypothetical protein T03_11797 [Trichinella britovi]|uniref:Uncharacterized protein n=2 Tax=Trichinella TaxID=6333 RepID=A0A0V1C6H6_TRIBR|nr:hypothetical protein T05_14301 [Trichinella murrelli]KRY44923.1 hypothetical protein T03_11797 [Trichinella britovi]
MIFFARHRMEDANTRTAHRTPTTIETKATLAYASGEPQLQRKPTRSKICMKILQFNGIS